VFGVAEFLHYALALVPESGVILFGVRLLIQPFGDLNQFAAITCDRVSFHETNHGMGNPMGKRQFFGCPERFILQSKKGS